jgi:DNA-binding response OmpR family regulator
VNESILVVDDDALVRKTLSSVLSTEEYVVETMENGKQALKAVENGPFDVALIDIQLPDTEGVNLLLKLKQKQPQMVRIIITGARAEWTKRKCGLHLHLDGRKRCPGNLTNCVCRDNDGVNRMRRSNGSPKKDERAPPSA